MATRYYLRSGAASGALGMPTNEQSPDVPQSTSFYGISGTVRYLYDMRLTPNTIHQYEYTNGAITPPSGGVGWLGWWKSHALNSGTLTGGSLSFYVEHGDWSNTSDRGFMFPRFHVYQWRPGFGKVTSILDPVNGNAPGNTGGTWKVFSSSFPYNGATFQDGDHVIFEYWFSSSFAGTPSGSSLIFSYPWNGFTTGAVHGQTSDTIPNQIASWIEFDENLPSQFTGTISSPSIVYMSSVRNHLDSNKLKVFFSAPVDTGSVANTSFLLNPNVPLKYAAPVLGTNNNEFDLHFGNELEVEPETFALWRFNEEVGSTSVDEGPSSFNLSGVSTIRKDGLYKFSRQYNGTNQGLTSSTGSFDARQLFLNGNFTIETVVRLTGTLNARNVIVSYASTVEGEAQADNYLFMFYVDSNLTPGVYWERGAGVDHFFVPTSPQVVVTKDRTAVLSVRVMNTSSFWSADTRQVDIFYNGNKVITYPSATFPDGGTSATARFGIATSPGGTFRFPGLVDAVRITSGAKSDAQIISSSLSILYPLTRGQVYDIEAEGVRDAAGLVIQQPSSSFTFQYLGENSTTPGPVSGGLWTNMVYPITGSYRVAGGGGPAGLNEPRTFLGMTVEYDLGTGGGQIVYTPPLIQNIVPAPNTEISSSTPIQFDVLDESDFRRIIIVNNFVGIQTKEVVHDGDNFGPRYTGSLNVRTSIDDGFRYVMLRDGGWPESPTMTPYAIDITGSENL